MSIEKQRSHTQAQTDYGCIKNQEYNFTYGLSQNINLRTHLKLGYNKKSLKHIQQNFSFQTLFLFY